MLKTALYAIPGANYVLIGWEFVKRYWKPIALALALAYTFNAGVKYERKKNRVAQLQAQVTKLTAERDNLQAASNDANTKVLAIEAEAEKLRSQVHAKIPNTGPRFDDAALRRLRNVPAD